MWQAEVSRRRLAQIDGAERMINGLDRLVMAVPDGAAVAATWQAVLAAVPEAEERLPAIGARSRTLRLGTSRIEILEPSGEGAVARAVRARGPHLFAVGLTTDNLGALTQHLAGQGIRGAVAQDRLWLDPEAIGIPGLRLSIGAAETLRRVGDIDYLYEATLLTADHAGATDRFATVFALDRKAFVPITSEEYGYTGTLTLFRPGRLARIEIITPEKPGTTMQRFHARTGDALYMGFAESDRLVAIERRLAERHERCTPVRPQARAAGRTADTLFVHPPSLGGMMLGLSRPSMAWTWSGAPDKVVGIDG